MKEDDDIRSQLLLEQISASILYTEMLPEEEIDDEPWYVTTAQNLEPEAFARRKIDARA